MLEFDFPTFGGHIRFSANNITIRNDAARDLVRKTEFYRKFPHPFPLKIWFTRLPSLRMRPTTVQNTAQDLLVDL